MIPAIKDAMRRLRPPCLLASAVRPGVLLLAVLCSGQADAESLRLPSIFSDHMVLQRDASVPVWGWADPDAEVAVSFKDQEARTRADARGTWRVELKPLSMDTSPSVMTVRSGGGTATIRDVLVGEVWLCSGQSNMEWSVNGAKDAAREKAEARWPMIRHIKAPRDPKSLPQRDTPATWEVCSPETVGDFSAVGYFFGRHLHRELGVPVGLVNCSWGGTRIEPWTPAEGFAAVPELDALYQAVLSRQPDDAGHRRTAETYLDAMRQWLARAREEREAGRHVPLPPAYPGTLKPYTGRQEPTTLYNGMMAPFVPFALRGSIWYQGESNVGDGMAYLHKTRALLAGWRKAWERPALPFYFVQIAPYKGYKGAPDQLPELWEAQSAVEAGIPGTGMVVVADVGNVDNIHPVNKQEVGRRLGDMALKRTYGHEGLVDAGPRFKEMKVAEGKVRLRFDFPADGLRSRDGKPLRDFELAGDGHPWSPARAEIVAPDTVELTAESVPAPSAVRFGWSKVATPNLMNSVGLPASPFRAGEAPDLGSLLANTPEAKDYRLVYELDLNTLGRDIRYDADRRSEITAPFRQIAYYLELGDGKGSTRWVFVSMDAFTDDLGKIGVPIVASGALFQQRVTGLSIRSNVTGLVAGDNLEGNIEFWPNNYSEANEAAVPGASDRLFDTGDRFDPARPDGYGSMQVHLLNPAVTVFSLNRWSAGSDADVGIGSGSAAGQQPDWTFSKSASRYPFKRLKVLVR